MEGDEFERFFERYVTPKGFFDGSVNDFVGTARVWVRRGGVLERRERSGYFE